MPILHLICEASDIFTLKFMVLESDINIKRYEIYDINAKDKVSDNIILHVTY